MREQRHDLTAGFMGVFNSGKSTVISAILQNTLLPTGHLETTPCPVHLVVDPLVVDPSKLGIFTRIDKAGNSQDLPIDKLLETMETDTAEKIYLYVRPSPLLKRLKMVDLAGSDSSVKHTHNRRAAEFARGMTADVIVNIITDIHGLQGIFTAANHEVFPYPRIVVLNKIDQRLNWSDPTVTPESVREDALHQIKRTTSGLLGESDDIVLDIHACSAIVALAGEMWSNSILKSILRLAEAGDLGVLSASHFYNTEISGVPSVADRKAISVAANSALKGVWSAADTTYQPAFPAIRYACGLAVTEQISSPKLLRRRLIDSSGIPEIRASLLNLTEDAGVAPILAWRRRMLPKAEKLDTEIHRLKRQHSQTSVMSGHVHHIAARSDQTTLTNTENTLTNTENTHRCEDLEIYLSDAARQLAADFQTVTEKVNSLREHYLRQLRPKRVIAPAGDDSELSSGLAQHQVGGRSMTRTVKAFLRECVSSIHKRIQKR